MLKVDLHIHSVHSGHAYGTIYDIMKEAAAKKMKMIAITDHGPSILGSAPLSHFRMGSRAPKEYKDVKILWGCEANIINGKGDIDLSDRAVSVLDILLVSFHKDTPYKDLGKERNTLSLINCFKKYNPHIFVHPELMIYEYDMEKVLQSAFDNNVLIELNLSVLEKIDRGRFTEGLKHIKKMIKIAKKNNKKLIVNSDAHFLHEIGDDSILKKYKEKIGLINDMIINNFPEELNKFLKDRKNRW